MTTLTIIAISLLSLLFGNDEAELVFAGDAMQHQAQLDAAWRSNGVYDYSECFKGIEPYVKTADYAVVNLETPVGKSGFSGYPCFYAPESYVDALANAGFDMMLTANNHTLDRQDRGLKTTIAALNSRELDHIGTYANAAERAKAIPYVRTVCNIKIGFLNYTYGTNGISPRNGVVVDYIDRKQIDRDIMATRAAGAEVICVCVHWGIEYQLLPNAAQRSLADYLTDRGVDLIIGGHPHVIQPMEIRHSDKYDKDILVVYSLGNFISNMKTRDTRGGVMVRVRLLRQEDGTVKIDNAVYKPVFTIAGEQRGRNFRVLPAEDVTETPWSARCKEFIQSMNAIFSKHNHHVNRDW
jgi:poly-gamma-glutamate synthesis protein (capsule biosynthesis protein)